MENPAAQVDVEKLRKLYASEHDYVRAFFDYLAERHNNSRITRVERALHALRVNGYDVTRNDVIWLLKELDELRVGDFIVGRRGQRSRFLWATEMITVGRAARGEDCGISALAPEAADPGEYRAEDVPPGFIRHTYNLRPDMIISVDLPTDLTPIEAQRFSDYVRTLFFEEVSGGTA